MKYLRVGGKSLGLSCLQGSGKASSWAFVAASSIIMKCPEGSLIVSVGKKIFILLKLHTKFVC